MSRAIQAFLWSRALNSGHINKESDDQVEDEVSPMEMLRAIAIFLATQSLVTALLLLVPACSDPSFLNGLPRQQGDSSLSSRGSSSAAEIGRGFAACRVALPWALGGAVCFASALCGQVRVYCFMIIKYVIGI